MNGLMKSTFVFLGVFGLLMIAIFSPLRAQAHCDTVNGPVAGAGSKALETGDFELIAIWVGEGQEKELRKSFDQCLSVYKMGGEAKSLAEKYFLETAVRLHREAEGMSFTGLKPAKPLPEDIAAAEKALESGDLNAVNDLLMKAIKEETSHWFQNALEAKKHKDESVMAGREWVDAYVKYVVYIHGLHMAIKAGPAHGVED